MGINVPAGAELTQYLVTAIPELRFSDIHRTVPHSRNPCGAHALVDRLQHSVSGGRIPDRGMSRCLGGVM